MRFLKDIVVLNVSTVEDFLSFSHFSLAYIGLCANKFSNINIHHGKLQLYYYFYLIADCIEWMLHIIDVIVERNQSTFY